MKAQAQEILRRRSRFSEFPLHRFVQFCIVGTSGLVVDNAVLFVLVDGLGGPILISKVIAAEVAMGNNFLWNDRWTFGDLGEDRGRWGAAGKRFLRFNAFCALGLAIQVGLLQCLAVVWEWNLYLSNLLAIGAATGWNFGMNYWWNWGGSGVESRGTSVESRKPEREPRMDANRRE